MAVDGYAAIDRARVLLLEAALDGTLWPEALSAVAAACGARSGQLIDVRSDGGVGVHWLTEVSEGFVEEVEAFGLANPVVNPRMRIGAGAPLMKAVADQDYVDAETRARHPIYAELFDVHDLWFNCQVVVRRDGDRLTRMSVSRTRRQGPMDAEAFRAFDALAPYTEAAVRFQSTLDAARLGAVVMAFDAVSAAAYLLDEAGRVVATSAGGESLAASADIVRLQGHDLLPARPEHHAAFIECIGRAGAAARSGVVALNPPLTLWSVNGDRQMAFDIQPLPLARTSLAHGPAVLVLARPKQQPAVAPADLLIQRFALTPAEAAVALHVAEGDALADIAEARAVSMGTVRSQLQSIYAKMDLHRQAELVLAIRALV
ncbi:helix-turn-helix transcriptional regulator [Brevundimonas sp.]|uniref:helix-turn-helix transcriptional regulator n=1 Tax=Brevundimonas sp. TaxID=1871086 RepID=UPI001D955BBB|nr:helix-turn-helix transcriptional regulator [Brevundimonas sp.]MBL0948474.1 helix-turn-helix transcriptional regulator [Brevundimonas sp.]